ncbi:MAG TPA: low temperature requirement protein A [Gaiellaceae bacterium]|nr:low temperature requirement protein A [Gaiellaceae bacterium]
MSEHIVESEQRVTPLELFFDLVFVFAFTQVTTLLLDHVSWGGLGRGLLVLAVLWWAWASYAWLTNTVDAEAGPVMAVILVAIGAMFVAALAVPEAFGSHRLVFALALLVVLATFIGLFALAGRDEPDLLAAVLRMSRTTFLGGALILGAAFVGSGLRPAFWVAALAVGFVAPGLRGVRGWRVQPAHFAERHGLIVIIAIGEALVAIGFGARNTALGGGVVIASVLGLVVAASFWLAYFDFFSAGVQRLLSERRGEQRVALARDAYTYLHLPMVVGIVLFAFGTRTTLAHVHSRLHVIPALALCCGSALYLLAYVALRWRVSRRLSRGRAAASVGFLVSLAVAVVVPAIATLSLVAAIWIGLHAYELIWWREARARRRAADPPRGQIIEHAG